MVLLRLPVLVPVQFQGGQLEATSPCYEWHRHPSPGLWQLGCSTRDVLRSAGTRQVPVSPAFCVPPLGAVGPAQRVLHLSCGGSAECHLGLSRLGKSNLKWRREWGENCTGDGSSGQKRGVGVRGCASVCVCMCVHAGTISQPRLTDISTGREGKAALSQAEPKISPHAASRIPAG